MSAAKPTAPFGPDDATLPRSLRIVSGGQTGVDRGALDAALAAGAAVGGWCPRGRRAEDGRIPDRYPLREAASPDPAERTRGNVRDSDATLVLAPAAPGGGSALAAETAVELGRPLLVVDPRAPGAVERVARWLRVNVVSVLNVAGPRASEWAEGYDAAFALVSGLLSLGVSPGGGRT